MKIVNLFLHFLIPGESNNHRARALSFSAISFYITALLVFQIGLSAFAGLRPGVLGYASNINVGDLLNDTNAARARTGAPALALTDQLSAAATAKAADMFANQYWAHVSPAGKDPWSFIVAAGYSYLFAGENLARDFGDSQSVVTAWMNSPSHRENLLNSRFRDVGFAVVNGKYGGAETTLVVQMFGAKPGAAPTVVTPAVAPRLPPASPATPAAEIATPSAGMILRAEPVPPPKVDILGLTRNVSGGLAIFLVLVLAVDGLLVYKRRTVRLSGHNLAHLLILLALLAALNLIGRGVIL